MGNTIRCDHCSYAALHQKYGVRLIVQPCKGTLGGTNVYWGKADERHFLAWFLELTSACTCHSSAAHSGP